MQAFQYLGYTADLQSSTHTKKSKEKNTHNILLKWTEHTVTSIGTPTTLVEFQKWLEVPVDVYDKINQEKFQQNNLRRNNFNNSGNSNVSDNHARNLSIQSSGFPVQPTNRNKSTTISSSDTVKPPSAPPFPPLKNVNQPKRFYEKCRGNHILATCPDYQKCSPSQQFDIVSKSNLCSNCLSNKHKKQNCPSTKRCLIQSAKRTLSIILGSKRLSFDIFETIMVEVEAILNSRPLTNVTDQPENEAPLTPNHFLIQRPYSSLPSGNSGDQQPASFRNWKHVQQLMNHVWRRVIKEYVPTLLKRRKWTDNNQPPLKVGDVVWVLKNLTPRGIWPLGRVVETSPGRDCEVRVAKVKTAYGSFVRPVAGLARVFSP